MTHDYKGINVGNLTKDMPHLVNYPKDAYKSVFDGINTKIVDFMWERTTGYDSEVAIEYFGVPITYGELKQEKILEYAKALSKFGISKGDYITLCLPNIPETVYLKYAANMIGAASLMLDPRINSEQIARMVNKSKSVLLFCHNEICKPKIEPIKERLMVEKITNISPTHSLPASLLEQTLETSPVRLKFLLKDYLIRLQEIKDSGRYYQLDKFLELSHQHTGNYISTYEENHPATALCTSGTTADNLKACVFSNENYNAMVNNLKYISACLPPGKRFLGVVPYFSAYGSFCGFHNSFSNIWLVVLVPKINPNKFIQSVIKHKANVGIGVPAYWEQLTKPSMRVYNFFRPNFCRHIDLPITGGDETTVKKLIDINSSLKKYGSEAKIVEGYGETEFGGSVSVMSNAPEKYNLNSVGILLPGFYGRIVHPETGEEIGLNERGELELGGPTMTLGYLGEEEKTKEILTYDKYGRPLYKTGDIMSINEKGELFYYGRLKRVMMRPDGHTVANFPIERRLKSHFAVDDCVVVGIKIREDANGTIPTAFIKLKSGVKGTSELARQLDDYCLEDIGERERALVITYIKEIPYTKSDKIDFRDLERRRFDDMDIHIMDSIFFDRPSLVRKLAQSTIKKIS